MVNFLGTKNYYFKAFLAPLLFKRIVIFYLK